MRHITTALLAIFLSAPLWATQGPAKHPTNAAPAIGEDRAKAAIPQATPVEDTGPRAKVVQYGDKDIVRIRTKLRHTTLIVLPRSERILDFTCGDKEFWVVDGTENFAYVKPAKASAQTNLNLITASGNIYSFVLDEVTGVPEEAPDLKVFVELKDTSLLSSSTGMPRFVSTQAAEDYRQQVEIAKEETRQAKQSAEAAIDQGINQFVSNVRFPYRFEAGKKPFGVRAIYHDDKFTYIQARPQETPALYEIKDGKPNLVHFQYKNGVYVVEKILDHGYLAIGKQKLSFKREEK